MLSLLIKVFSRERAEEHSENRAVHVVPLGHTMQADHGENHNKKGTLNLTEVG